MYTLTMYEWNLPNIKYLNNTLNEIKQNMQVLCTVMYLTLPKLFKK